MNTQSNNVSERGTATLELALTASFFFMLLILVVAGAVLFFTRSALVETTRRGARYAAMQAATNPAGFAKTTAAGTCDSTAPSLTAIKNYAIYGNAAGSGPKLVNNIDPTNICVQYSNFGVGGGNVSVSIVNFTYSFPVPGVNQSITMPSYRSTFSGESAGTTP